MRGWSELFLFGAVTVAAWTRTPVGALAHNALAFVRDQPTTDVLASFRTELPEALNTSLAVALTQPPPATAPIAPTSPSGLAAPGAWTPALRTATSVHLGPEALEEALALDARDPEAALELRAIGRELRARAIRRAGAAGEAEPERLASHSRFLPAREAKLAQSQVSEVLSLATAMDLSWPVATDARVTSPFGYRDHPVLRKRKLHEGVDIAVPVGTPVHAAGGGEVNRSKEDRLNGKYVVLSHGHGVTTAYCHGDALHVTEGARVERGALIMDSGNSGRSTGPHLHFGLRINGRPADPGPFRERAAAPATG